MTAASWLVRRQLESRRLVAAHHVYRQATTRPPITEWVAAMSASILRRTGLAKPGHRARKLGTPYSESTLRLSKGNTEGGIWKQFQPNLRNSTPVGFMHICSYFFLSGRPGPGGGASTDWTGLRCIYPTSSVVNLRLCGPPTRVASASVSPLFSDESRAWR